MTAATHPHIYLRDIDVARRTSLSVLASLVPVGCNVLDLGTGSGALLGRKLFHDPILSRDSTISCASCHLSFTAFSHVDHKLSHGIHDSIGTRNAPALMNLAWNRSFMWDGAVNHLDMQPLAPINNQAEMGESTQHVLYKLERGSTYRPLFYAAFGDSMINAPRLLKALAQFQASLVSCDSRYDRVKAGTESESAWPR